MRPLLVTFAGGEIGFWAVERLKTVAGAPLEPTSRLEVIEGSGEPARGRPAWVLRGVTSNERYVSRIEHEPWSRGRSRLAAPVNASRAHPDHQVRRLVGAA